MYDHRNLGKPTTQPTFLRLTPVPKKETATLPMASSKTAPTKYTTGTATNACTCAYCTKHVSPNTVANTTPGLKALTNCACSPCSSAGGSEGGKGADLTTGMESGAGGEFELLPAPAMELEGEEEEEEEEEEDKQVGIKSGSD